jgi:hypothetical protein
LYNNNQADSPPGSMSIGAVVGIVVAATIIIIVVFGILWWKGCFGKKKSLAKGDYKEISFVAIFI